MKFGELTVFAVLYTIVIFSITALAFAGTYADQAYVTPSNGVYVVRVHCNSVQDITISKPMSLDDAKNLADTINKDMAQKWFGSK